MTTTVLLSLQMIKHLIENKKLYETCFLVINNSLNERKKIQVVKYSSTTPRTKVLINTKKNYLVSQKN